MDADYDLDGDILTRDDSFSPERKYSMPLPRLLPSQQKVTELLSHLASYSELLVTVTGPDGSGKTTIAQALASVREEPEDTLLLSADLMTGMPAILAAIAGRWDLPHLPDDMVAARGMIRDAAIERSANGGALLVIIDQAEQMDSGTLNEIANFALQVPQLISFALFGLTGFADVIRENPANAPLHRLELDPLFPDEAAQLIQQVYTPGQALPLADDELDLICHQSDGRPAGILLAAEDYLLATAPAAAPKAEKKPSRFPVTHILAIAAVAAAIGMLFLYSNSGDDSGSAELAVATQRIDLDSLPLSGSSEAEVQASDDALNAMPEQEVQTLSSFGDESTQTSAEPVASATDYNYGGGNKEVIAAVPVAPEVAEAPAVTPPASREVASPVQKLAQPDAVKPAASVTKPVSAAAQRTAAEKTLLAAKSGFVVQLFGSYKSDSAAAFRKQWQEKVTGSLYQYQTVHSGRPWHVVVAGVFGTRAEAQAAVNAMPAELRKQSPWIRDVSAVQDVLR